MSKEQKSIEKNPLDEPVFKDDRGEIRRHEMEGVKYNALFSKAGILRSGDMHPNTQYDLILMGEFEITLRQGDEDVVITKKANELLEIPPDTPHLFRSVTDTVMIEWWDGPFEAEYYEPYRKLIEAQLEEMKKGN